MQGGMSLLNIAAVDVIRTIIHFLHQIIIIIAVFVIYDLNVALDVLLALIGLMVFGDLWCLADTLLRDGGCTLQRPVGDCHGRHANSLPGDAHYLVAG